MNVLGCRMVCVPRSSRLYWKVEGIMKEMSDGVTDQGR